MEDPSNVGEARRFALNLCAELDFDETRKGRVGIIVNELGNNLIRYAQKGELILRGLDSEINSVLKFYHSIAVPDLMRIL